MPEPGMGSQNEYSSQSGPGHEGSSGRGLDGPLGGGQHLGDPTSIREGFVNAVGMIHGRAGLPIGQALQGLARAYVDSLPKDVYTDPVDPPRGGATPQSAPFRAAKMTVAQKRNAGIFHNAAGTRVTVKQIAANATARLIAGQKLTKNQQAVVGKAVLKMSASQKRQLTNNLALAKYPGQNVNTTQKAFNRPLKQAMQAARKVAKNARKW